MLENEEMNEELVTLVRTHEIMLKQNEEQNHDQEYMSILDSYDPTPSFLRALNLDEVINTEDEPDPDVIIIKGKKSDIRE
jgi:hypothetical protein